MNNKSRECLLAEGFAAFKVFLDWQYKALAVDPVVERLELSRYRGAWEQAEWKILLHTGCKSVIHFAARQHIFVIESLLAANGEVYREILEAFPNLELTDEEFEAKRIFDRAAATDIERLTLLACLWLK